ncbi:MAG TPA: hypothetical protein VF241_00260 [Propionibacteriaceae bacterium]
MQRSSGDELRRVSQRSWIAFLGGLGLLAAALLGSLTSVIPDLITTVAAIIGIAGMIYGVAIGILIVVNREPDERSSWKLDD